MAIHVKRRGNESTDQLLVRFNKSASRFVKSLRRGKYFQRRDSRLKKRIAAVIRESYRADRKRKQYYN